MYEYAEYLPPVMPLTLTVLKYLHTEHDWCKITANHIVTIKSYTVKLQSQCDNSLL